jgi:hypothetical protein
MITPQLNTLTQDVTIIMQEVYVKEIQAATCSLQNNGNHTSPTVILKIRSVENLSMFISSSRSVYKHFSGLQDLPCTVAKQICTITSCIPNDKYKTLAVHHTYKRRDQVISEHKYKSLKPKLAALSKAFPQ